MAPPSDATAKKPSFSPNFFVCMLNALRLNETCRLPAKTRAFLTPLYASQSDPCGSVPTAFSPSGDPFCCLTVLWLQVRADLAGLLRELGTLDKRTRSASDPEDFADIIPLHITYQRIIMIGKSRHRPIVTVIRRRNKKHCLFPVRPRRFFHCPTGQKVRSRSERGSSYRHR